MIKKILILKAILNHLIQNYLNKINFRKQYKSEISGNNQFWNLKIGEHSYISYNSIVCNSIIGNYSSIGPNCVIGFGEHPTNFLSTSPNLYNKNKQHENYFGESLVEIGNDVWIGANVFIKNGLKIGDGAIIGAGSVVIRDVESFSIVAGNPARIIKYRFTSETIDEIKKLKWWNWDSQKIIFHKDLFESEMNSELKNKIINLNINYE